jgi:hypothetical protein
MKLDLKTYMDIEMEMYRDMIHCKAGEAYTSLKTASCEAGPGTTLIHSMEI